LFFLFFFGLPSKRELKISNAANGFGMSDIFILKYLT